MPAGRWPKMPPATTASTAGTLTTANFASENAPAYALRLSKK